MLVLRIPETFIPFSR